MSKIEQIKIPVSIRMKIRLTKLNEVENPMHPNNIPEGHIVERYLDKSFFKEPTVGERFCVGYDWSTSNVLEVLSDNIFTTYNSVYKWEII